MTAMLRVILNARRIVLQASLLGLGCMALPATAQADETQVGSVAAAARDGVLLLRNGRVVRGRILDSGDVYHIEQANGNMAVPATMVRVHARSLGEAYRSVRETVQSRGSAAGHISLARWCLANQLTAEARRELADALELEPESEEAGDMLQRVDGLLKSAASNTTSPEPAAATVQQAALVREDAESLGGLAREEMKEFSRRIQPILMNNCAAAGCHHAKSETGFRLQRVSAGVTTSRLATDRNIAEVLEQIDLDAPRTSPLLTVSRKNHGRKGRSPFAGPYGERQFAELQTWVQHVARTVAARQTATPGSEQTRRTTSVNSALIPSETGGKNQGGSASPAEAPAGRKLPVRLYDADGDVGNAPAAEAFDPFDPTEFNRSQINPAP